MFIKYVRCERRVLEIIYVYVWTLALGYMVFKGVKYENHRRAN
jgi:hypothetical protein